MMEEMAIKISGLSIWHRVVRFRARYRTRRHVSCTILKFGLLVLVNI